MLPSDSPASSAAPLTLVEISAALTVKHGISIRLNMITSTQKLRKIPVQPSPAPSLATMAIIPILYACRVTLRATHGDTAHNVVKTRSLFGINFHLAGIAPAAPPLRDDGNAQYLLLKTQ